MIGQKFLLPVFGFSVVDKRFRFSLQSKEKASNTNIRESPPHWKQNCGFPTTLTEKAMAPHSSTLAWKIPWTEEPGGLQFMESRRVGHDWATSLSLFTFMHWRRKWQPTTVFLPGEFQRQWAPVYVVAQSWTWLKWLSSNEIYQCSVQNKDSE